MRRLIAGLALAGGATPALAHGGHDHVIGWTFDAQIFAPLLLALALYAVGFLRLWTRSGGGRSGLARRGLTFLAGWTTLALALLSPLHEGGERSFALHMIEHELVMLPAALLLVAARPGPVLLWSLPALGRRWFGAPARWSLWHVLADPVVATCIQGVALVGWHLPFAFDRALRSEAWHTAQHISFLASALLFWWAMLRGREGGDRLTAAACLFVTSLVGGALGALMSLASSPWYSAYAAMGATPLGLSPVQDQQLAGLIMWVPGGLFHLGAALLLAYRALRRGSSGQPQKFSTTAYAMVTSAPIATNTAAQTCQRASDLPNRRLSRDMEP